MHAMLVGRLRLFAVMPSRVAEPASGNNILRMVGAAIASRNEMFSGALELPRLALCRNPTFLSHDPNGQFAVIAPPTLFRQFRQTNDLKAFH